MGTWSAEILGNDTSCDIHERYLELFNSGIKPNKIVATILEDEEESLEIDRTNVWLAIALASWECNALTKEILQEVKNIVSSGEDLRNCEDLDADEDFLDERRKVVNDFISKISSKKPNQDNSSKNGFSKAISGLQSFLSQLFKK
jgi:hypothetical protein